MVDYFDKSMVIYGIDCERCHGPAKQHVNFHEKNPQEKKAQFITQYDSLPRQARLDLCAQCHSGAHPIRQTIFNFKPGDTLGNFFRPTAGDDISTAPKLDVHGNQYQLMAASACFKKTTTLDCATCHNSHTSERDNMKIFSQRCMNCHTGVKHKSVADKDIIDNCIDCHMPAAPSRVIGMKSEDKAEASPNLVRTHLITTYRDATQRYIDSLKRSN